MYVQYIRLNQLSMETLATYACWNYTCVRYTVNANIDNSMHVVEQQCFINTHTHTHTHTHKRKYTIEHIHSLTTVYVLNYELFNQTNPWRENCPVYIFTQIFLPMDNSYNKNITVFPFSCFCLLQRSWVDTFRKPAGGCKSVSPWSTLAGKLPTLHFIS